MLKLLVTTQIIVASSVIYVWVFRYDVVMKEFKQFGLSDLTRSFTGASKVALATLLITGIWYPSIVPISALLMGLFMLFAQYFHFKIKNPIIKFLPSLMLLLLCIFIMVVSLSLF